MLNFPGLITNHILNRIIWKGPDWKHTSFNLIPLLFIYTDIIEYQLVGDEYATLLRINTVQDKLDENCWHHYDSPHYLKCKNYLEMQSTDRM